jgi:choline-sulfatase
MVDQWRLDGLGSTGGWVRTPHLDQLAAEGTLFDNCLTNSPVCIPARLSFATGLYPHNTGVWGNVAHDIAPETETWMQAIRQAGYRTCIIGKSHWHRHEGDLRDREHLMNAYGFDDVDEIPGPRRSMIIRCNMTEGWEQKGLWASYTKDYEERFANKPFVARPSVLPFEEYADVYVGRKAAQYLREYEDDKPWFCMVSFGGPHEPWDAPEPYASMYEPGAMPKPIPRSQTAGEAPQGFLHHLYEPGNDHSPAMTDEEIAKLRANYAGNITLIDEQIGDIVQVLKERGEWDNTAVVFVSDHGEMNGDHGLIYKENFYNSAVKVPLIVRLPESENVPLKGNKCSSMVEWFDVGPTLCELAGGRLTPRFAQQFGKSLVTVLRDPSHVHRSEALCEIHGEMMIQNEQWKMAVNRDGVPYMLYNLERDPEEQVNLVADPESQPIVNKMTRRLMERLVASQNSPNFKSIK